MVWALFGHWTQNAKEHMLNIENSYLTSQYVVAAIVGCFCLCFWLVLTSDKAPPLSPTSAWENIKRGQGYSNLVHNLNVSEWVRKNTNQVTKFGTVFRQALPLPRLFVICCDYNLAKVLLEGGSGVEESEKLVNNLKALNLVDGINSMFT